jgi:hypothetical protein
VELVDLSGPTKGISEGQLISLKQKEQEYERLVDRHK